MPLRPLLLLICLAFVGAAAKAADLESLFANVASCHFEQFFYDEPNRNPPHAYFTERDLKPYKEDDGLYYFYVKEMVFGLPVVELIVPGTQDLHAIIFDAPLANSRKILSAKFGSSFAESANSLSGKEPALVVDPKNSKRSVFYCVEGSGS
jgi:hypothetical protein